jgi:gas vesicle protein
MRAKNGLFGDIAFVAAGGLIGAGIALLLAPQSGKQTRQDLLYYGKIAKNRSERIALDVGHKAQKLNNELRDAVTTGKDYLQRITGT